MDLLTVVTHELGHVLGFGDLAPGTDALMGAMLAAGERHLAGGNGTGEATTPGQDAGAAFAPTTGTGRTETAGVSGLIDWARPYGGEHVLGGTNGSATESGEIVPRLLDFTVKVLPGNGNGNGYASGDGNGNGNGSSHGADGAPVPGKVAWGPLSGKESREPEILEFAIALEPDLG